jgi:hypothetical protein
MTPDDLVKITEGLIVIAGIGAVFYAVFKNSTVKATIQSQKELIETLTTQVAELRTLHIENEKAISELKGQVSVYKELPLGMIAESIENILITQKQILTLLKKK